METMRGTNEWTEQIGPIRRAGPVPDGSTAPQGRQARDEVPLESAPGDAALGPSAARGQRRVMLEALGERVLPPTATHPDAARISRRAGVLYLVLSAALLAAFAVALTVVVVDATGISMLGRDPQPGPAADLILYGTIVVALAVVLPQAAFRVGAARQIRAILDDPHTSPDRIGRDIVTFDPAVVSILIAAGYIASLSWTFVWFTTAFTGAALIRAWANARARRPRQPLITQVTVAAMLAAGAVTYLAVRPFAQPYAAAVHSVDSPMLNPITDGQTWVLLPVLAVGAFLGGTAYLLIKRALLAAVGVNTVQPLMRALLDPRRLLGAVLIASVAWAVYVVGEATPIGYERLGSALAFLTWLLGWAVLWVAAAVQWRVQASRSLRSWEAERLRIVNMLASGSMAPAVAQMAAMQTAARVAASVFGAQDIHIEVTARGSVTGSAIESVIHAPLTSFSTPRIRASGPPTVQGKVLKRVANDASGRAVAEVTVGGWMFLCLAMTRSPAVVNRFIRDLTESVVIPTLVSPQDDLSVAYDLMFDPLTKRPGVRALEVVTERMIAHAGSSGQHVNVLLACFQVRDFGQYCRDAHAFDRDGSALTANLMRIVSASPALESSDYFVADGRKGRIWLALGRVPSLRQGLHVLSEIQREIAETPVTIGGIPMFLSTHLEQAAFRVDGMSFPDLFTHIQARANEFSAAGSGLSWVPDPTPTQALDVSPNLKAEFLADLANDRVYTQSCPMYLLDGTRLGERPDVAGFRMEFNWRHARLGVMSESTLRGVFQVESDLAHAAAPHLLSQAAGFLRWLDATTGSSHLKVMASLPSQMLVATDLEISEMLAREVGDPALYRRLILHFMEVPAGADEGLAALVRLGVTVSVEASTAPNVPSSLAALVGQVSFSGSQVERTLLGDRGALDTAKVLFPRPGVRFLASTASAAVEPVVLRQAGFTAVSGQDWEFSDLALLTAFLNDQGFDVSRRH